MENLDRVDIDALEKLRRDFSDRNNFPFYRLKNIFGVEKTPEGCLDVMEWLFENGAICLVDPIFDKADNTYHGLMGTIVRKNRIDCERYSEIEIRYRGLMERLEERKKEYIDRILMEWEEESLESVV